MDTSQDPAASDLAPELLGRRRQEFLAARAQLDAVVEQADARWGCDTRQIVLEHRGAHEPYRPDEASVMTMLGLLRHGALRGHVNPADVAALCWLELHDQAELVRLYRDAMSMARPGCSWQEMTDASWRTIERAHRRLRAPARAPRQAPARRPLSCSRRGRAARPGRRVARASSAAGGDPHLGDDDPPGEHAGQHDLDLEAAA
jgi:hypothetical protein